MMAVSRETAITIIAMLADGKPIVQTCRELGVNRGELYLAIDRENLADMLARAREEYAEARVAEMQNIAETVEDVGRAKLLCDNIKWETCRIAPKRYGDKVQNEHTGANGEPIQHAVNIAVTFHEPDKAG
jgi:hypothetical protein